MSIENLFEAGGLNQLSLIRPYLDNVLNIESMDYQSFRSYFMSQIRIAIELCREREVLPDWAFDENQYWANSEIMIGCNFADCLSRRELMDKVDLTGYEPGEEKISDFVFMAKNEKYAIHALFFAEVYDDLLKYGKARGWDMIKFQYQMMFGHGVKDLKNWECILKEDMLLKDSDYN